MTFSKEASKMAIRFRVRAVMTASIPVRIHLLCHYTQSVRKNQAEETLFSDAGAACPGIIFKPFI